MNGSKPNSPVGIGRTTSRGHARRAVRCSLSPHPGALHWYPFSVAQISNLPYRRFVIGRTLLAADRWQVKNLRYGRLQVCATGTAGTLNTYLLWGEGEGCSLWSTLQAFRLSRRGARCSLSLPPSRRSGALARREGGRERVRVRGNGAHDRFTHRTIPGTVKLDESSGETGGFRK